MLDTGTSRRRKAARLRSETDTLIKEIAQESLAESGLLDLVLFGTIEIVVFNRQIKNVFIKPSFDPKVITPELTNT